MNIRQATAADQSTINHIIRDAGINRMSLDWKRFIVAEDDGRVAGVGQIKPHGDGSRELASIAVIPERQGQGIGSEIIRTLVARDTEHGTLYLTCRQQLETYYARFGFSRIERNEMPPYFRRITRIANLIAPIFGTRIVVMKRQTEE